MARELTPEEICPGNENGTNQGKRHIGEKQCFYCPAKTKRRKNPKEVVTFAKHSWSGSDFRQLTRGRRIAPGESYELGTGIKVTNETERGVWLVQVEYGLEAPVGTGILPDPKDA